MLRTGVPKFRNQPATPGDDQRAVPVTDQGCRDIQCTAFDTTPLQGRQDLQDRQAPVYALPHRLQICPATRLASSKTCGGRGSGRPALQSR